METINKVIIALCVFTMIFSCEKNTKKTPEIVMKKTEKSIKQIKGELLTDGFQIFDYVDEKTGDTVIMQGQRLLLCSHKRDLPNQQ